MIVFSKWSWSGCRIELLVSAKRRKVWEMIFPISEFSRRSNAKRTLVIFSICTSSLSVKSLFPFLSKSELKDWHKFRISSRQCDTCWSKFRRYDSLVQVTQPTRKPMKCGRLQFMQQMNVTIQDPTFRHSCQVSSSGAIKMKSPHYHPRWGGSWILVP